MTNRRLNLSAQNHPFQEFFHILQDMNDGAHSAFNTGKQFPSYPHCDVTNLDEETNQYHVSVALAGFNKEDIDVSLEPYNGSTSYARVKILSIMAKTPTPEYEDIGYQHKGIKNSDATLKLMVHENDKVQTCTYNNGLLQITMYREEKEKDGVERIDIM